MTTQKAIFGADCFWGVEARFAALPGVLDTAAGFAGGDTAAPTYEQVCAGTTGHAEVVEVTFNPARITYPELLDAFFAMHNPVQPYRADRKPGAASRNQYRSVIFTHCDAQRALAEERLATLRRDGVEPVTDVLPAATFWRAEERHQRYFEKRNVQG